MKILKKATKKVTVQFSEEEVRNLLIKTAMDFLGSTLPINNDFLTGEERNNAQIDVRRFTTGISEVNFVVQTTDER